MVRTSSPAPLAAHVGLWSHLWGVNLPRAQPVGFAVFGGEGSAPGLPAGVGSLRLRDGHSILTGRARKEPGAGSQPRAAGSACVSPWRWLFQVIPVLF